jgi:hypothetical protein
MRSLPSSLAPTTGRGTCKTPMVAAPRRTAIEDADLPDASKALAVYDSCRAFSSIMSLPPIAMIAGHISRR